MTLPEFAPFPEATVRQKILPAEWELYLDSWKSLSDLYLRLNEQAFVSSVSEGSSLTRYLVSFFHELPKDDSIALSVVNLRKKAFLLFHRICSSRDIPLDLLHWTNLANVCHVYPKSGQLRLSLQVLWQQKSTVIEKSLQPLKTSLIKTLDSKSPESAEKDLTSLAPLLKTSPGAAAFMLTGSDFLDSLNAAYVKTAENVQRKLVTIACLGLLALLEGPKPSYSVLSDHLYSLKSTAEKGKQSGPTGYAFLADLVTNTPLLHKIRDGTSASEGARVKNIAASLETFRQTTLARPKKLIRRKPEKGKGKATDDLPVEVHIHRMSMISQIQDLFPELGSGFVVKLLDKYNDNVEEVTAHLLEESLPSDLANADRTEQLPNTVATAQPHLIPRSTPPLERRNVFDDDEFDKLAVDASRLHIGRRNEKLNADRLLSDRRAAPSKSAILSALAAFDADDDERDDTYDAEDVGGTVDSSVPATDELNPHEEELFRAYTANTRAFARDNETRRSKERGVLKSSTGLTDEAIEGWAVMLQRDPRRLRRLEARYSTFTGQQSELASTSYRHSPADSGAEGEEGSGDGHRGGRGGFSGRGRGRGRGRGGGSRGGGNVAGPSEDKSTQASRHRKEANKGSRANHNRREQRARKVARAGFPG
ncbi:hypothetical protein BDV96DRAFT_560806 [Lophiotrema nucula]|uniref:CUE domain-containing protein n=1 Tax=Lophiotrema nucula TaxID=690887 RepID=A0A6A5ZVN7_9PLEO|nr:hypothetical protein BDV96DRAFT_560806 [Lophiotrema nucula]